jgi:anti-sigma regulatory factor (Ser/Thr protein kinase)
LREHSVHYYDDDARFAEVAVAYLAAGLEAGERVIAVVTADHLRVIERGLVGRVDVGAARAHGMLQTPDAARTLASFLVDGSPDPALFHEHVAQRVVEAGRDGTPVRAFGEMVALLWGAGNVVGAIELEDLWSTLLQREPFSLMCAYPTASLPGASLVEINRVCHQHDAVLPPSSYRLALGHRSGRDSRTELRSAVFLPVAQAVGAARRFVADVLDTWELASLDWDAALVVSELANNAVRHGRSSFRVLVSRAATGVRVGVQDVAPGRPLRRRAADGDVDGRGMTIVAGLSQDWGCEQLADGKYTWAELALPAGEAEGGSR